YNFLWGMFNLVPIPPLDGSWILFRFLPRGAEKAKMFMQQYGLFILIFFIFFGGLTGLSVLAQMMYSLVAGAPFGLM
ncbi:MAG: site-2 protease family protein, partial [Patescibacteria group bacterium]